MSRDQTEDCQRIAASLRIALEKRIPDMGAMNPAELNSFVDTIKDAEVFEMLAEAREQRVERFYQARRESMEGIIAHGRFNYREVLAMKRNWPESREFALLKTPAARPPKLDAVRCKGCNNLVEMPCRICRDRKALGMEDDGRLPTPAGISHRKGFFYGALTLAKF